MFSKPPRILFFLAISSFGPQRRFCRLIMLFCLLVSAVGWSKEGAKEAANKSLPAAHKKISPQETESEESLKNSQPGKVLGGETGPHPAKPADLKIMKALDSHYQKTPSVTMAVDKSVKGMLGDIRNAKGQLTLSKGRLRMELSSEGTDDKSMLVVNKKTFWAVTFPSHEFKEAKIQVVTGSTATKKGRSQSILGLLTQGGFLKFFEVTGVQKEADGDLLYFLQPEKQAGEFKRAQLKISSDGKEIHELHYWDELDNETKMTFKAIKFGKKLEDAMFSYAPPSDSDVMQM
jgi:outer membrane lipoprotein-sorting protein